MNRESADSSPHFHIFLPNALIDFSLPQQKEEHAVREQSQGQPEKLKEINYSLKCNKCSFKTDYKTVMAYHEATHSKLFYCESCQKRFATKQQLEVHQLRLHQLRLHQLRLHQLASSRFRCEMCSFTCKLKISLLKHNKTHNKTVPCESCGKMFATHRMLKIHQKHQKHGFYAVEVEGTSDCDEMFSTPTCLIDCPRNVIDENKVECEVCFKICKSRKLLLKHSLNHVKDECSVCNKMISITSMTKHLKIHSIDKPFECDFCNYSTKIKVDLILHIERAHLLRKLVNDSTCHEDFRDFELLDKLQRKFGSSKTLSYRKFKCDLCEKYFVTQRTLKHHRREVHVEKTFVCEICEMIFKGNRKAGQRRLKSHMKIHQTGKYVQCDLCGHKFNTKNHLKEHFEAKHKMVQKSADYSPLMVKKEPPVEFVLILPRPTWNWPAPQQQPQHPQQVLDVVKPKRGRPKTLIKLEYKLKCDRCLYQTDYKGNLRVHMKNHSKRFHCETCSKKFFIRISLKHHQIQRKHGIYAATPEKTFDWDEPLPDIRQPKPKRQSFVPCTTCGKVFATRYELKKHQKNRKHGSHKIEETSDEMFFSTTYSMERQRSAIDENKVDCDICNKICKSRKLLLKHSLTHVKDECSVCNKMISMSSMTKHLKMHSIDRRDDNIEKTFACEICEMTFKGNEKIGQRQLKSHMKMHRPGKHFECDFCGHKFNTKNHLKKHFEAKHKIEQESLDFSPVMVKHEPPVEFVLILPRPTGDWPAPHQQEPHQQHDVVKPMRGRPKKLIKLERILKCDRCSYQTGYKGNLRVHMKIHSKRLHCESCAKKFSTKSLLKLHQMQHKHGIYATTPEEAFDCEKCDKSFSSLIYLRKHQLNVHDDEKVKCGICDKIFKNLKTQQDHSLIHIKVGCSICHKMISKKLLARHLRAHSSKKSFQCDLCDCSVNSKGQLKQHIERVHLLRQLVNDSACRSDLCDFKLLTELQLRYGNLTSSGDKKFKCDECHKSYVVRKTLNRHKNEVHVEKNFECGICKKNFRSKRTLTQHQGFVHLKVSCSICKKEVGQMNLERHMKFHQSGNQIKCDLCDYKATRKSEIEYHITNRHRNGALACSFMCREKFSNFGELFRHYKIHIGKKKWKCRKCDFKATARWDLFNHMTSKKHNM